MNEKEELKGFEQQNKKFRLIDLIKNKRYYAILNLTFYSILIIVLIIGVRGGNNSTNNSLNNKLNFNNETAIVDGFQNIKNKNFMFTYTLQKDNEKIIYEGKQNNNKIFFKNLQDNKEYVIQDSVILEKKEEQYVLTESPIQYFDYLNVDLIEQLLSKLRKDESDYILSMNDFIAIINSEEKTNEYYDEDIFVEVKKQNNIITELVFNITPFVSLKESNVNSVKLYLQYKDFGLVEDFEIK